MLEMVLAFLKMGTFIFGGGLAIVAFMQQDAVTNFGWVTHREFVDAIAMGQITPGPFVISSVFIGYKVGGLLGSILAITAIAAPSFLMTVVLAGQLHRIRRNLRVQAFIRGVSPAIVGMILAAATTLGRASIVDIRTAALAVVCLVALVRFKVDTALVVVAAGLIGYLIM